jgi:adapter protein MecA 1/2
MNIEILSQDKLRVDLNCSDLDKYDLDYLSISTESPGTRRMLKDILLEAGEAAGFSTKNCKLLIEVMPGKTDGCVLYLTKMPIRESRRRRVREPESHNAGSIYILSCGNIEDAIGAINCFAHYPDIPLRKSSLYNFQGRYLLTFAPVRFGLDSDRITSLLASLSEYGETGKSSPVKEAVYAEHGCTINDGRAVESFMRYFH